MKIDASLLSSQFSSTGVTLLLSIRQCCLQQKILKILFTIDFIERVDLKWFYQHCLKGEGGELQIVKILVQDWYICHKRDCLLEIMTRTFCK